MRNVVVVLPQPSFGDSVATKFVRDTPGRRRRLVSSCASSLCDLGGFVHGSVVKNDDVYAVAIDDGVLLDAAEQLKHARRYRTAAQRAQAAAALGCKGDRLDVELDARRPRPQPRPEAARRRRAARPRRQWPLRLDVDRGPDFAAGIWVIDPVFVIDTVRQRSPTPARRPFARSGTSGAPASTTRTSAMPPRTSASGAPPSAPAVPRPPPATPVSATTSAPRSPTPATTSSTPSARSSAACSAGVEPAGRRLGVLRTRRFGRRERRRVPARVLRSM
jgi:hypothetical protein